jgi:hypothetical protein
LHCRERPWSGDRVTIKKALLTKERGSWRNLYVMTKLEILYE